MFFINLKWVGGSEHQAEHKHTPSVPTVACYLTANGQSCILVVLGQINPQSNSFENLKKMNNSMIKLKQVMQGNSL